MKFQKIVLINNSVARESIRQGKCGRRMGTHNIVERVKLRGLL
jgi:hypothetical protein